MSTAAPWPTELRYVKAARRLEIDFDDGVTLAVPAELLRVESPSAEVRGHGASQKQIVPGKKGVAIQRIEPVGNYAIRPVFSDGHDSGLYSWDYLYQLGENRDDLWQTYLVRLEAEGGSRDPADLPPPAPKAGGCGHH